MMTMIMTIIITTVVRLGVRTGVLSVEGPPGSFGARASCHPLEHGPYCEVAKPDLFSTFLSFFPLISLPSSLLSPHPSRLPLLPSPLFPSAAPLSWVTDSWGAGGRSAR